MNPPTILVDQPTAAPTRKVAFGATAGALATIIAWASSQFAGVVLPPGVEGALAVAITFCIGWGTRDEAQALTIIQAKEV